MRGTKSYFSCPWSRHQCVTVKCSCISVKNCIKFFFLFLFSFAEMMSIIIAQTSGYGPYTLNCDKSDVKITEIKVHVGLFQHELGKFKGNWCRKSHSSVMSKTRPRLTKIGALLFFKINVLICRTKFYANSRLLFYIRSYNARIHVILKSSWQASCMP